MLHFIIYKFNPATGEKVTLHEKMPESIVDWLCKKSARDLGAKDKAAGFIILKESQARPPRAEVTPVRKKASVAKERSVKKTA